jgi:dTDP-4-amino-4,6-dideoxygalactose transaminase
VKKYFFKKSNSIGKQELSSAIKVIKSGVLSKFVGTTGKDFYGGPMVQKFERSCEKYFKVKHAVTVNSWTSGLVTIIGSIGIEPGDEIIVTPWTMCASATAILHWNAIPVFVDIEDDTFNINPNQIEEKINSRTKAILTVDIFGHSCDIYKIMKIAKKYNLVVISDSAQAIGSKIRNKFSGTVAHVGGFSLNYHKHINTGEGGIIVTNKKNIYNKLCLIRNHGEAVIKSNKNKDLINVIGHNFRLGEIEAAIGIAQLRKLKKIFNQKYKIAINLQRQLRKLPYLKLPVIKNNYTHAFYIFGMVLDLKKIKRPRRLIVDLLRREGVPSLIEGYQNVHLLPMYQKKIAYGSKHFPWSLNKNNVSYNKGICPVAENLHQNSFFGIEMCIYNLSLKDVIFISKAFKKVWKKLNLL